MKLLEIVKGRAYSAREYRANDFEVSHELTIDFPPFSRRRIDYKVAIQNGRKYWTEIRRHEFVHFSIFFGKWREGWNYSEEELARQTII